MSDIEGTHSDQREDRTSLQQNGQRSLDCTVTTRNQPTSPCDNNEDAKEVPQGTESADDSAEGDDPETPAPTSTEMLIKAFTSPGDHPNLIKLKIPFSLATKIKYKAFQREVGVPLWVPGLFSAACDIYSVVDASMRNEGTRHLVAVIGSGASQTMLAFLTGRFIWRKFRRGAIVFDSGLATFMVTHLGNSVSTLAGVRIFTPGLMGQARRLNATICAFGAVGGIGYAASFLWLTLRKENCRLDIGDCILLDSLYSAKEHLRSLEPQLLPEGSMPLQGSNYYAEARDVVNTVNMQEVYNKTKGNDTESANFRFWQTVSNLLEIGGNEAKFPVGLKSTHPPQQFDRADAFDHVVGVMTDVYGHYHNEGLAYARRDLTRQIRQFDQERQMQLHLQDRFQQPQPQLPQPKQP